MVSAKAFKNGKIEFKTAYKEAVTVRSYDLPLKAAKEMVKTLKYQLKSDFKRDLAVLESNVADLRRKTPVEVFLQNLFIVEEPFFYLVLVRC